MCERYSLRSKRLINCPLYDDDKLEFIINDKDNFSFDSGYESDISSGYNSSGYDSSELEEKEEQISFLKFNKRRKKKKFRKQKPTRKKNYKTKSKFIRSALDILYENSPDGLTVKEIWNEFDEDFETIGKTPQLTLSSALHRYWKSQNNTKLEKIKNKFFFY